MGWEAIVGVDGRLLQHVVGWGRKTGHGGFSVAPGANANNQ
jgi:hypothetical protein